MTDIWLLAFFLFEDMKRGGVGYSLIITLSLN